MENKRTASPLPYVRGGIPDAFRILLCAEAVLGILACLASVFPSIIRLTEGTWTVLLTFPLSVFGTVLSVKMYLGLRRLSRGDANGADTAKSACRGKRIMVWLSFVMIIILEIAALGDRTYGVLAILLSAGLSLAVILPLHFYYQDAEQALEHVFGEACSGKPTAPRGLGRLPVLCIILGALLMILSTVMSLGLVSLPYYASRDSLLSQVFSMLSMFLFFGGARYLLLNLCLQGFRRSHALCGDGEPASFAPAGYGDSPSLCILGSVIFGWFAFSVLLYLVRYPVVWRYRPDFGTVVRELFYISSCVLLGLSLMRRRGRYILALSGAAGMAFFHLLHLVMFNSSRTGLASQFGTLLMLFFYGALIVAFILRKAGKTVPGAFLTAMIVLAAVACCFSLIPAVNAYSVISALADACLTVISMLALVWKLKDPAPEKPAPAEPEPEKEAVPDQV